MSNLKHAFSFSLITVVLAGCAATPQNIDPMEGYNREMYRINKSLDKTFFKPVAFAYDRIVPSPLKSGVRNVYSNINQVPVIGNDLLQGEPKQAANDTVRLLINSSVGILGLFDVATGVGFPKHEADFGQTLAKWGYKRSAYFVIPIIGPSTIRDTLGRGGDFGMSMWPYMHHKKTLWWSVKSLEWVSNRADLLGQEKVLGLGALDEYKFVRDGYLQRRDNLIHRGSSLLQRGDSLGEPPE